MNTVPMSCAEFDEAADELALGAVDEPRRGRLLSHAASCPRCQHLLDGLGTVADRLLLLAPEVEPPAGFEHRVAERLGLAAAPSRRTRPARRWAMVAAAVVAVAAIAVAVVAVRFGADPPPRPVAATAPILSADGTAIGSVQLLADPTPHVLVSVAAPRPGPGVRTCSLQRPDGSWVVVGSWTYDQIASGVWAAGIDASLLDATAMRVTADDGAVLASATFG